MRILRFLKRFIIIFASASLAITFICCNRDCKDEYHYLPENAERYYEDNDTIVFYCEESDEYATYEVCNRGDSFMDSPQSSLWCDWIHYDQYKAHAFYRDSCDSDHLISTQVELWSNLGTRTSIAFQYGHNQVQALTVVSEPETWNSYEILGIRYEDVSECEISWEGSISSMLYSQEYGVVQYVFENKIFSLLKD